MLTGGPEGGGDDFGASATGAAGDGGSLVAVVHATSNKVPVESDKARAGSVSLMNIPPENCNRLTSGVCKGDSSRLCMDLYVGSDVSIARRATVTATQEILPSRVGKVPPVDQRENRERRDRPK
jgi:hypothetical protein